MRLALVNQSRDAVATGNWVLGVAVAVTAAAGAKLLA